MDLSWLYALALVALNNLVLYIWKPWTAGYAGEKGKNLARKEDLDKILAEVRAVTITQREIEAKISGDMWERQWRLSQKRDVYARLLESMSELELNIDVLAKYFKMQPSAHISDEVHKHGDRVTQIGREIERAMAVARVYLPPSAIAAFKDLQTELRKPDYVSICAALVKAQEALTFAARADLGIETAVPASQSA